MQRNARKRNSPPDILKRSSVPIVTKVLVKSLKYKYISMYEALMYYCLVFCFIFEVRNNSFDAHRSVFKERSVAFLFLFFLLFFSSYLKNALLFLRDALIVWER